MEERRNDTIEERRRAGRWVLGVVTSWAVTTLVAGRRGLYEHLVGPGFAAVIVLGVLLPVLVIGRTPGLRAWGRGASIEALTLLHVWRVPAALVFFEHGDVLPETFVRNAAFGDFFVGCAAPLVVLAGGGRGKWWLFHVLGALDLVLAVGTGLTLTLLGDPGMAAIKRFPLVLVPALGVCLTGVAHAIAFDKPAGDRTASTHAVAT